jgi:thiol-disulfide isomerase/thioredoxin
MAVFAVAAWPACNRNTADPTGPPIVGVASDETAMLGKPANLAFSFADFKGAPVSLADFKGRPLLVNVWATWCGPCRLEIPWFVDFVNKYKAQRLAIVGVSFDDPPADIEKFVTEVKVNYPMLVGLGHDAFFKAFEAESIYPVSWIVKPDGTVQAKALGAKPREWFEQQIEATF